MLVVSRSIDIQGFVYTKNEGIHPSTYIDEASLFDILLAALLGVQVVVSRREKLEGQVLRRGMRILPDAEGGFVLLGSPGHGIVADDEGGRDVEHLLAETAEGVEDGVVGGAGERVLLVRAQGICDDASLLDGSYIADPSVPWCNQSACSPAPRNIFGSFCSFIAFSFPQNVLQIAHARLAFRFCLAR